MSLPSLVFLVVYLGMALGKLPRLQADRAGIALLGAITLVVGGELTFDEAAAALDFSTLALLFALMVVSAQLRLGGFYTHVTHLLVDRDLAPPVLLGGIVAVAAALSAVFSNDVVCLALPLVVLETCRRRHLDPVPFLLATAFASNVGSAATLIGNPQNMLIGQVMKLSFRGYTALAALPVLAGLVAVWSLLVLRARGSWQAAPGTFPAPCPTAEEEPPFDRWQTAKGWLVCAALVTCFLATDLPREVVALGGAGVLLMSRKLHSRKTLGLVDWQLLVLFAGLFVVNATFRRTGIPEQLVSRLAESGVELSHPFWLFLVTLLASNLVSNVPAVMLLLPFASGEEAGAVLALSSTLAGNLTLTGSIANLIVVDSALRGGIVISWRRYLRDGVPVTLVTCGIAMLFLWLG